MTSLINNEYVNYIEVTNHEKEHHLFVAEYKQNLLKYGYLSLFVGVLRQNGSTIGFTTILFNELKTFTQDEIEIFQQFNGFVEISLQDVNSQFIQIVKKQI